MGRAKLYSILIRTQIDSYCSQVSYLLKLIETGLGESICMLIRTAIFKTEGFYTTNQKAISNSVYVSMDNSQLGKKDGGNGEVNAERLQGED